MLQKSFPQNRFPRRKTMKSVVVCLFVLLIVGQVSADLSEVYNGIGNLSIKLLRATDQPGENTVHSSLSISEALAMCLVGATGPTFQSMVDTMGISGLSLYQILTGFKQNVEALGNLNATDGRFTLNKANKLYLNDSIEFSPEFILDLEDNFRASAENVDFSVSADGVKESINSFVKNATNGLIPEILTTPLPPTTLFTIINAVYFKSTWRYNMTYDKRSNLTFNDLPCSPLKAGTPKWLKLRQRLRYISESEMLTTFVELPYKSYDDEDVTASMLFLLPDESKKCEFTSWLETLTWKKIREAIVKMNKSDIILRMPEVDIETRIDLSNTLKSIGMEKAFSEDADFSGMVVNGTRSVKIDSVLHQAKLKIDKKGTEASAVTFVIANRISPSIHIPEPPPIPITIDRSYVALILLRQGEAVTPIFSSIIHKL